MHISVFKLKLLHGSSRCVFIVFLLLPFSVLAQNMMVLGNNARAQDCFRSSTLAVTSGSANHSDVKLCSDALSSGTLKKHDRVATFVNRGIANELSGQLEMALSDYSASLKQQPEWHHALSRLARIERKIQARKNHFHSDDS